MQSVGQRLREARLERGRSLEDVSASTRIAIKNLRAIEADELEKLGSPFFYRSFVRQFARELKLDDSEFASDVQAAASTMPEPLMPGQGNGPFPAVNALPVRRPRSFKWLSSLASLIVMLVACSAVYAMWQNSRSNFQASFRNLWPDSAGNTKGLTPADLTPKPGYAVAVRASDPQASEAGSQPAAKPVSLKASRNMAERVQTQPVAADPVTPEPVTSQSEGSYRIELSAIEPTWLSINADGQQTFSGILEATDTKVLEARENVRIRTGNAGGVNVVLNGKALGTIGPRGQIRTVIFTKDAYEVLPPEPHMSLTQFSPNGE
jgi:cytoskeleton protein RodZ